MMHSILYLSRFVIDSYSYLLTWFFEFWIGITNSLVVDFSGVRIINLLLENGCISIDFVSQILKNKGGNVTSIAPG